MNVGEALHMGRQMDPHQELAVGNSMHDAAGHAMVHDAMSRLQGEHGHHGHHEHGHHEAGHHEAGRHEAGRHEPGRHEPGRPESHHEELARMGGDPRWSPR